MKRLDRLMAIAIATTTTCTLAGMLFGCGGGSQGEGTGRLALTVEWPQRSRLIPQASNSIKAVLSRSGQTLGTRVLSRSGNSAIPTTVTFDNLDAGSVTLSCTGFPNSDGTGVAQATGSAPATIVSAQTTQVTVTMNSTIDHLTITPPSPTVVAGQTTQLTMTAFDAANNVVLVSPAKVQWASGAQTNATVSGSGLVSGIAEGAALVSVTETESNKSASATVTVTSNAPPANTAPNAATTDRAGKFLYVADNGARTISQFRVNADGTLSPLTPATVSVALPPYSLAINRGTGKDFLYVGATDNNNGAVYQFRINANGTLAPLAPASAVSTQQPIAMETDSQGRFLYSADHNFGLRSYVVNGDGTLTRNGPDTPSGQAFSLAVSPNDKFVLLGSLPAQSLAIQPDGKLVKVGDIANFGTPDGITINPASTFAYATASVVGASGIQALALAPDGTTTAVGAPVPFGAAAYKVVITPDGKFVYAVSLSAPDNVVGQFKVNANGSLTPLSPATVPAGSFTTNVTVSPDGKFLYTTNYRDNTVSQFRINADGTLTPLNPPFVHG